MQPKIALIYHSGTGHTAHYAQEIAKGLSSVKGVDVEILEVAAATQQMETLSRFHGFLFGSPTYMGNVSGPFKSFMDATGGLWGKGALKNRWAAGFTVSGSPSGDKLLTLQSLAIFASQHGMFWVGNHTIPETYQGVPDAEAANRLGSFLGAMAQAAPVEPAKAFVPGDLKTARIFGERFARVVAAAPRILE